MQAKRSVKIFISLIILIIIIFFGALYIYDPLKLFHKPWVHKDLSLWDMRQNAAGIINNQNYDSIILGSSVLENTSSAEASKFLGGNFINISISGSDFWERSIVLNYALQKKNIKKVIFSLDNYGIVYARKGDIHHKQNNWDFLYDNNPINDFKIYMNDKYLKCLLTFSNKHECVGIKRDPDRPNAWYKLKMHEIRYNGGMGNWFKIKKNMPMHRIFLNTLKTFKQRRLMKRGKSKNIVQLKNYLNETILRSAKNYPNTEFIFVLPPYSRVEYAIKAQYYRDDFELYKSSLKYLMDKSIQYHNIKIFGWGNENFVDNLSNYRDFWHFSFQINSLIIKYIQSDKGLLTVSNIDDYLNIFTQKALDYNLSELNDKIEQYAIDLK